VGGNTRDGSTPFSRMTETPVRGGFRVSGRSLAQTGKAQTDLLGRTSEIAIPGHDDDFLIAELQSGSEMNRVVAAKSEIFGVLTSAPGKA
jgi:hypothetical protein